MPPKNLYKVLEVDPEASPDVIEAAYRRLARRYHPDLNPSPDATAHMQALNDAYATLRDPARRAEYDAHLRAAAAAQARASAQRSSAAPKSAPMPDYAAQAAARAAAARAAAMASGTPVACQACGRSDATLRIAGFPYVMSFLVFTHRREERGVYCESCRREKMSSAKTSTAILGWWGIPWGLIHTLGALAASGDGIQDSSLNADYLRWLGTYFLHTGNTDEAKRSFQASLSLRYDPELAHAVRSTFGEGAVQDDAGQRRGQSGSQPTSNARRRTSAATSDPETEQQDILTGCVVVFVALALVFSISLAGEIISLAGEIWPSNSSGRSTSTADLATAKPQLPIVGPTAQAVVAADTPTPTPTPTRIAATPTPTRSFSSLWHDLSVADGAVTLSVPADWEVIQDETSFAVVGSASFEMALMVLDRSKVFVGGNYLTILRTSRIERTRYRDSIVDYLTGVAEDWGGEVVHVGNPETRTLDDIEVACVDALLTTTLQGRKESQRVALLLFDCAENYCAAHFYREGEPPYTTSEWSAISYIVASVTIN
jgi:hypothetical protein